VPAGKLFGSGRACAAVDPEEEALLGLDPEVALRGWERPVYMVHEHFATRHHFDLRLEFDGVLKSWAVPKGLSDEPGVKRLAVEVPDHALSYAPFEGTIPEGNYGAGKVSIWDRGTFEAKEHTKDKVVVDVRGQKMKGVYHMVRTRMGDDPRNWLIFLGQWPPKTKR
jgi:DNA ligase D-like protein (predicted 3'-phosphoesterase)